MNFLNLAPHVSESYPKVQTVQRPRSESYASITSSRRSSDSTGEQPQRVLKLAPVHWGEHVDENKDDIVEVVPATAESK